MAIHTLRCSFCRKTQDQVSKLVAGPHVYICDECVAAAVKCMQEPPRSEAPEPRSLLQKLKSRWPFSSRGDRTHEASLAPVP